MIPLILLLLAAEPAPAGAKDSIAVGHRLDVHTQPKPAEPEYGHGLDAALVRQGYVALFDGKTKLGWTSGLLDCHTLWGGRSSTRWGGRISVRLEVKNYGRLVVGDRSVRLGIGFYSQTFELKTPSFIRLADGLAVGHLAVAPLIAKPEKATWRVIKHPRLPDAKQTAWSFDRDKIRGVGGPGCVELQGREFGDFILQATVTTHRPLANGGIFFRAITGDFMNGYEAQVFNGCLETDPAKPSTWSTGALDDRMNARRVVSRDGVPFYYTINAEGPHLAVWINGFQQVDWTDERSDDDNARKGRRTKPGALQLQAHDAETDVEFADVRVMPLD